MCSTMPLTSAPRCTPAAEVDKRREQEAAAKQQDTAAANEINNTPGAEQGMGFRHTWQSASAALGMQCAGCPYAPASTFW